MVEFQRLPGGQKTPLQLFLFSTLARGHSDQPCSGIFNVMIFVFSRSGFHREQPAPVNVREIAVWKFVSALRVHTVTFVHTEMPLRIFGKTVSTDELVFRIRRRFVLAPCAFAISDRMSFLDELRRERDGMFV